MENAHVLYQCDNCETEITVNAYGVTRRPAYGPPIGLQCMMCASGTAVLVKELDEAEYIFWDAVN